MIVPPLTAADIAASVTNARIGTKLVLEENGMRVWHLCLAPGEAILPHRHDRPYFWTVLTDGRGRSRYGDGRIVEHEYKTGETKNFPDLSRAETFVHDLTNIGNTELTFVTVEFDR